MSSEHNHTKNSHKPSGIAKFFLGFSLGILICVLVIFVVKNSSFFQKIESIDLFQNDQTDQTVEETQMPKKKVKKKVTDENTAAQDSIALDSTYVNVNENGEILEDAEFTIDPTTPTDNVAEEKISQTRTVKVHVKNANLEDQANIPDNIIAYFEVQKWDSPIVNRISYQRDRNILKIKGMDISKLSIFYINGKYYISDGSRLFSIPNNNTFEKLSEINIANL
jgi:hypothetical protein